MSFSFPLAAALATLCRADEAAAPDFFDIIGSTPAEVSASFTRPVPTEDTEQLLSGFVGLPMSGEHRNEFAEGLRGILRASPATKHYAVLCFIDLLAEDGRLDEAIELLRSDLQKTDASRIREAGLLWKAGNPAAAAELALQASRSPSNESVWLSLVKVDLIKGRPEEAMRMLGFFQQLDGLPARIRHLLAIQHLEIARQEGKADALIAASPSPALRAVWHSALGRKEKALEAVQEAGPGVSAADIEMLVRALRGDPLVVERAAVILARADLPLEQRRSLLGAFDDSRQRFQLWSAMGGGHEETVDLLEPLSSWSPPDEVIKNRQTCHDLMAANPGSARLKWLVAKMYPGGPEQAKPLLLEVARAFRENPEGPSAFGDPARGALEILVKTLPPDELKALVVDAPGFADLPAPARLRYLMAADLDREVVATMKELKFDEPAGDHCGGQIRQYFERRAFGHVIPDEVIALLLDRLPEMVVGSPSKSKYLLQDQTGSWLKFFGTYQPAAAPLVQAIHRMVASAETRGPELRNAVLAGLPDFAWRLPGLALERPPSKAGPPAATPPPPYLALSIFSPPDPAVIGQGAHALQIYRSPAPPMRNRDPFALSLLASSPWEQNVRGIQDRGRFDPAVQAKLRTLFDKFPSRTLIYDLLVATGQLECPDPAVKASAERRIAGFDPKRQADPSVAQYLFFQRLSKGTPLDECLPLLDGQQDFTRPSLERVSIRAMALADQRHPSIRKLVRERMGFDDLPPPRKAAPPTGPLSAYDRMQFFIEAKTYDSPEAVALAREVLFKFVESNRAETSPDENIAIWILTAANQFDAFLADMKAKLVAAGRSELEVQRALYRVHLYRTVHAKGEGEPFARRVFELDPADTQAAGEVLAAAVRTNDPELALKCLEALGRQSRELLLSALNRPAPNALGLFSGPRTRELAEALLRIPLPPSAQSYRPDNSPTFRPLYLHVARHDPDHLKPLLRWTGDLTPARGSELISLARGIREVLAEEVVLDLLAEALFTPTPPEAPDSIRFQPKAFDIIPDSNFFNLTEYARSGWAERLAEIAADYPPSDSTAGTKLLVQLAADPTPATWERLVPGFIATLPVATRDEVRHRLEMQVRHLPDSAALQNFLTKGPGPSPEVPPTLDKIMLKVGLAAEAGDRTGIPALWESAKKLLPAETAPRRLDFFTRTATGFAMLAEPAMWIEFLEIAGKAEGFAEKWIQQGSNLVTRSPSPARVADLARVILPQLKPDERNSGMVLTLFDLIAGIDDPDVELLKRFRPWIDVATLQRERGPLTSARGQWLDLLSSDLAAVCPQATATLQADSTWSVDWSLAGFKGIRSGYPAARKFAYLDGRFDLEILAGPSPERLAIVSSVAKAAATGRVNLKLPGDAKFISILARQADGGIIRWSHPVAIDSAPHGGPVDLRPVAAGTPGVEFPSTVVPAGGPFQIEDARQFELPPGAQVELARLPWTGGAAPAVTGWILNSRPGGSISLSFRAADDTEISRQSLESGDYELESMPLWRWIRTPAKLMAPSETVTIALVFTPEYASLPTSFRISELRVVPPPPAVLPDGFTFLGRMPGAVGQIALDSTGNRIAVASSRSGVGVFDFATREFSGWIPLGDPDQRGHDRIVWIAIAGDRLLCAKQTGEVYLVSIAKRSAKLLRKIDGIAEDRGNDHPIQLSPDGIFLAWSGIMAGLRIAKLGDEGIAEERLIETDQIHWMGFKPGTHSLEAIGGDHAYTLDLADWRNAALAVRRSDELAIHIREDIMDRQETGRTWVDLAHDLTFRTGSEGGLPESMDPLNRFIMLPPGLVAADGEGRPFFISNYGHVLRIDVEKMKGYQPPVKK